MLPYLGTTIYCRGTAVKGVVQIVIPAVCQLICFNLTPYWLIRPLLWKAWIPLIQFKVNKWRLEIFVILMLIFFLFIVHNADKGIKTNYVWPIRRWVNSPFWHKENYESDKNKQSFLLNRFLFVAGTRTISSLKIE